MRKLRRLLYGMVLGVAVLGLAMLSGPARAAGREVDLTLKDIAFMPTQLTVTAGEQVHLVLKNIGALPHNFSSTDLGINQDVQPGKTAEFDFAVPDKPGTYPYFCNQPGHKEAGMEGTIVVAAAPAPASKPAGNPPSGPADTSASSGVANASGAAAGPASGAASTTAATPSKLPNTGDGSVAGASHAWGVLIAVVLGAAVGGALFWRQSAKTQ